MLRLLCLLSLTTGVSSKTYQLLKREVLHSYGYTHLFTLQNLERMGMFTDHASSAAAAVSSSLLSSTSSFVGYMNAGGAGGAGGGNWTVVRKLLRLYSEESSSAAKGGWPACIQVKWTTWGGICLLPVLGGLT